MSKLEELMAELCPDGVEFKPLWEVTVWDKKFNAVDRNKQPKVINYPYLLAAELFALEKEGGNVFLLSTGLFQANVDFVCSHTYQYNVQHKT